MIELSASAMEPGYDSCTPVLRRSSEFSNDYDSSVYSTTTIMIQRLEFKVQKSQSNLKTRESVSKIGATRGLDIDC